MMVLTVQVNVSPGVRNGIVAPAAVAEMASVLGVEGRLKNLLADGDSGGVSVKVCAPRSCIGEVLVD